MFYVYLLKSLKDKKYYIGQTSDIKRRLEDHNRGRNRSTKYRRPFMLIGYEIYATRSESRFREHQIKTTKEKKKFIEKLTVNLREDV